MSVSDIDAITKANCSRCKAKKGNPCVYTPPPRPPWIPEEEFLARIPTNAELREKFARAGKPMKTVHQERREATWRSAPRGTYTIRVDRKEFEELCADSRKLHDLTGWHPLHVGATLHGYCGGAFGRESYGDKTIEAIGPDWVVVRTDEGAVEFSTGDPDWLREYL